MPRLRLPVLAALLLLAAAPSAWAKTVKVSPDDGATPLADGLAQLEDGDKLVLQKGVYGETLELLNLTSVTVRAKKGAELVAAPFGVTITGCTDVTLKGLLVRDVDNPGMRIEDSTGVKVTKCEVLNASTGISIGSCSDVEVSKCTIEGVDHGVVALFSDDLLIRKNSISAFDSSGITVAGLPLGPGKAAEASGTGIGCEISKNDIEGGSGDGIIVNSPGVLVEKNDVVGVAVTGIWIGRSQDASGAVVRKNDVVDAGRHGIEVSRGDATVEKNDVDGSSRSAIVCHTVVTLVKNKVVDAGEDAIIVLGDDSRLEKNKLKGDLQATGIDLRANDCVLEKNDVRDAAEDAIFLDAQGCTLTRNKTKRSGRNGLFSVLVEEANTFEKNAFDSEHFGTVEPG